MPGVAQHRVPGTIVHGMMWCSGVLVREAHEVFTLGVMGCQGPSVCLVHFVPSLPCWLIDSSGVGFESLELMA